MQRIQTVVKSHHPEFALQMCGVCCQEDQLFIVFTVIAQLNCLELFEIAAA